MARRIGFYELINKLFDLEKNVLNMFCCLGNLIRIMATAAHLSGLLGVILPVQYLGIGLHFTYFNASFSISKDLGKNSLSTGRIEPIQAKN